MSKKLTRTLFLLALVVGGILFTFAGTTYVPSFVTSTTIVYGKNVVRDSIIPTAVTGGTKYMVRGEPGFGLRVWCVQATANDSMRIAIPGDIYADGTQKQRWMVNNDTIVFFLPVNRVVCDSTVKKGASYPQLHFEVYTNVKGDIDDLIIGRNR